MKHILQPGEGEILKRGPPVSGEVILKVDPQQVEAPFVTGTETLQRGAEIPVHRHRERDEVWCVLKGQGRATVEGQAVTVVPGAIVYAPKQTWHGLRNTGTGALQILWVSAPSGLEAYYRDRSRLGPSADSASLQELAERHGVEFRPGGAPTTPQSQGRPRRRRRRGGRPGPSAGGKSQQHQPAAAEKPASSSSEEGRAPAGPPSAARPSDGQKRAPGPRRQPRSRRSGSSQQKAKAPQSASNRSRQPGRGRRRSRVKEVYMGGKWVRVEGEGPVIST